MARPSSEEDHYYWNKWITDRDNEAADYLLRLYLPLVNYHVQRICVGLPQNINKEDLNSHGIMGLYDALEKFDTTRDLKFDTYASFRIRGAIIDGLRKEDWLSRSMREKTKKIDAMTEQLEQKYMRNVTTDEVAEALDMTTDDVAHVISESYFANLLSIDENVFDGEKRDQRSYTIEDKQTATPIEHIVKEETFQQLAEKIVTLNKTEQIVVSLFYYDELTLTEIGQVLGLSTSRISQIHSKALLRLRHTFKQSRTKI